MLFAQVKFNASVSKNKVVIGEQFQLSFTLNTTGSHFSPPDLSPFSLYMGPNQSSSVQFINGAVTQSISISYVLAGAKEGEFTIAPATIKVGNKTYQSNEIKIEVVKSNNTAGNQKQNEKTITSKNENVFIRTLLNKNNCYKGEHLLVTHKVYSTERIVGFRDVDFPTYDGFWSQVINEKNQNIQLEIENIDGKNYYVAVLRQVVLFPQKTGLLQIKPIAVDMILRTTQQKSRNDFWDNFFGPSYQDVAYQAKGNVAEINVKALPESNYPAFKGSVGDFNYSAKIDKEKVNINEAVTLTITISGNGNLKMTEAPVLNTPEEIEVYDPKVSENISVNESGMKGSKTFEYVLIPRKAEQFTIQTDPFVFFNPVKKEYVQLQSPEFNITVTGNEKSSNSTITYVPNDKQELKEIGTDIRFVEDLSGKLYKKNSPYFGTWKYYGTLSATFAGFVLLLFVLINRKKEQADITGLRFKKAQKIAIANLKQAQKLREEKNTSQFYAEVLNALHKYLENKLSIDPAGLNKETISIALTNKNVSTYILDDLMLLINHCEMARYAPPGTAEAMENLYEKAKQVIIQLEEEL